MKCRQVRRLLYRAVDGELSVDERLRLDPHLARCGACGSEYARLQMLEELVVALPEPRESTAASEQAAVRGVREAIERAPEGEDDLPEWLAVQAGSSQQPGGVPGLGAFGANARRSRALLAAGLFAAAVLLGFLLLRGGDGSSELRSQLRDSAPGPVVRSGAPAPSVDAPLEAVPAERPRNRVDAERRLRQLLLETFADTAPDSSVDVAAERFDDLAAELGDWPFPRLAERLLRDSDVRLAGAAARYLGQRGDRLSVSPLADALERPDLVSDVLFALGDLGQLSIPALARATFDRDLGSAPLETLGRIGGSGAARAIEASPACGPNASTESRSAALEALGAVGGPALESLLRLAGTGAFSSGAARSELLFTLQTLPGGADALAALLAMPAYAPRMLDDAGARPVHEVELLFEAATLLQPDAALWWVEECARSSRQRDRALACLVNWEGGAPVAGLLRLDASGSLSSEDTLRVLTELVERDAGRMRLQSELLLARRDGAELQRYVELLVETGHAGVAPALVPVVLADLLPEDQRQWAALAIGSLGGPEEAQQLLAGAKTLDRGQRRLLAAVLLTLRRHLGDLDLEGLLSGASPRSLERVASVLRESDTDEAAIALFRVSRALDGAFASRIAGWSRSTP